MKNIYHKSDDYPTKGRALKRQFSKRHSPQGHFKKRCQDSGEIRLTCLAKPNLTSTSKGVKLCMCHLASLGMAYGTLLLSDILGNDLMKMTL